MEKEIELEQEAIVVHSGGGAVNSVNGYTGDVVLTTSDLENTSDYQTGTEVESAISTAIAGKQDTLTAGNNITISNNTISATDTTYSAGTGLTLDGTQFSVDTNTIATQQDVSNEATARENADTNLQGQIDAISASSDVTDIVGTYAALQAYDTTHLKDNDIIKVLQDESQNDETTYYRWSTSTQTFTLIGEEGPYYTKSQTDTLLQAKQDTLTAGSNITIGSDNTISATDTTYTAGTNVSISSGNVISATDTTYTAGTGLSLNGTEFSADTSVLATQTDLSGKQNTLTAGSNITISGDTISATDTTYSNFVGTDGTAAGTAGLVPAPATTDAGKFLKADGTWDTAGGGSGPTVVQATGTSTTDVMSQNAVTRMVYADPSSKQKVQIGNLASASGAYGVALGYQSAVNLDTGVSVGYQASARGIGAVALGRQAQTSSGNRGSIALGSYSNATQVGEMNIGSSETTHGYNNSNYRLLTGLYDPQSAHDAATKGYVDARTLTNAGAPTTSTVGTVGQLLEDTTNGKLYICTDTTGGTYTWVEVGAGGGGADVGKAKVLTSADYNWPTNNPTGVALWLLEPGIYTVYSGTEWYATNTVSYSNRAGIAIIRPESSGLVPMFYARESGDWQVQLITKSTGVRSGTLDTMMTTAFVIDDLTSTITNSPLSANQGKVLNDKITPASGSGAPTTSTVGILGKIYIDTSTDAAYMCTKVSGSTYTWKQITA